jgi:hypothetical protein
MTMWFKLLIDAAVLDLIALAWLAWEARNAPLLVGETMWLRDSAETRRRCDAGATRRAFRDP